MPPLEAYKPRYRFETAALDPETLQVVDFVGEEEISRLFRYELNLVSENPQIGFADVINKPATLIMMRDDEPMKIHGLIADFQQGARTTNWIAYRLTLVPRVWVLSLHYQSRVFQNLTVEEIVSRVLDEAGFSGDDYRFDLSGGCTPREYCVQYRETDQNFVSRLLEHEGIAFYFDHEGDSETLVMTDDCGANPMIEGESTIGYRPGSGMVREEPETVGVFNCQERIVTGKVVLKDYNYRTPETTLKSESQLNSDMPGQYYEYGQHFKDMAEGDRLARIRNEEIECARRVMSGESNCVALRAGFLFSLDGHYRDDLDGNYLITRVVQSGSQGAGYATPMGGEAPTYNNDFTCIPADVIYRPPRRTPVARIPGIMTARVESAGGEYAYIDEKGRYRVKMPFDLSDAEGGKASRPLRLANPYTGPNYGMHFPNHADTEMVWACIDGNVDRPLGLSTVPNPSNTSPSVAENKFQSVIRTAGQNELTMDDTVGSENIYLHATRDATIDVVNDESTSVGHDETLAVGNNRTKTVGADQSETVGSNKAIRVGSGHSETIGGNMMIVVGATLTETVGVNYAEIVGGAMELSVGAAMVETVGAAKTESIGGSKSESIGSNKTLSVGKSLTETIDENRTIRVVKDLSESVGGVHQEQVEKEYMVEAKKIQLVAREQITIKSGKAEITLKKNGDISIHGKKISIKGSGDVILKGSKIKEN